jgi:predicted ester cyclase
MESIQAINRHTVIRFNREIIQQGRSDGCIELVDPHFVNHSAPPGSDAGINGMLHTFNHVLRPAFPDLTVEVLDQMAEDDKVVTRKRLHGTHQGLLAGIEPTGKAVSIDVIDIVRLLDGKYREHWGINTFAAVIARLREP